MRKISEPSLGWRLCHGNIAVDDQVCRCHGGQRKSARREYIYGWWVIL
jgi:hypothetical protein